MFSLFLYVSVTFDFYIPGMQVSTGYGLCLFESQGSFACSEFFFFNFYLFIRHLTRGSLWEEDI